MILLISHRKILKGDKTLSIPLRIMSIHLLRVTPSLNLQSFAHQLYFSTFYNNGYKTKSEPFSQ